MTNHRRGRSQSKYCHQFKLETPDHWEAWCGAKIRNLKPEEQSHLPECQQCIRAKRNATTHNGALPFDEAMRDPAWEFCKPRPDGCWDWTGKKDNRGRGKVKRGNHNWYAARWIYALTHNGIDDKIFVVHSCHNPFCGYCVNPEHLIANDLPELTGYISSRVVEGLLLRFRSKDEPIGITSNQM